MKNNRGFTLIEVLIYIALFSLIVSGFFVAAYAIFSGIGRYDAQSMVQMEGDFLLAKIEQAAGAASLAENNGDLELGGMPLNNSGMKIVDFKLDGPDENGFSAVGFTLSFKTASGQAYSQDFSTIYFQRR